MVSGLSRRSVPASISSFGTGSAKNTSLRPSYQPRQQGWLASSGVRHTQCGLPADAAGDASTAACRPPAASRGLPVAPRPAPGCGGRAGLVPAVCVDALALSADLLVADSPALMDADPPSSSGQPSSSSSCSSSSATADRGGAPPPLPASLAAPPRSPSTPAAAPAPPCDSTSCDGSDTAAASRHLHVPERSAHAMASSLDAKRDGRASRTPTM
eukprot:365682-Chlamydomonas_euryale.AAC.4